MVKLPSLLTAVTALFLIPIWQSAESTEDSRQLVTMPAQATELMRADMIDHLSAISEIVGYLAENKLNEAASTAETRMGMQSMGKHRGSGMGPGKFMPAGMRNLGMQMHQSASEFARVAKLGDASKAYSAFQKVTNSCVACHYSYRTH